MVAIWMGEVWCHRRALGMGLELRLYNRVSERVCVNLVMRRSVDVRAREPGASCVCVPFVCVYLVCAEAVCTSRVGSHPFTALSTLVSRGLKRDYFLPKLQRGKKMQVAACPIFRWLVSSQSKAKV